MIYSHWKYLVSLYVICITLLYCLPIKVCFIVRNSEKKICVHLRVASSVTGALEFKRMKKKKKRLFLSELKLYNLAIKLSFISIAYKLFSSCTSLPVNHGSKMSDYTSSMHINFSALQIFVSCSVIRLQCVYPKNCDKNKTIQCICKQPKNYRENESRSKTCDKKIDILESVGQPDCLWSSKKIKNDFMVVGINFPWFMIRTWGFITKRF